MKPLPALLALGGVIILIISIFLPWISINLVFAGLDLSLYDMLTMWGKGGGGADIQANYASEILIALSVIFLFAAIITGVVGIVKHSISASAGALSILSAIMWVVGITELKREIAESIEFGSLVSAAVSVGTGPILVFIASIPFFAAFVIGKRSPQQEVPYPPPPPHQ